MDSIRFKIKNEKKFKEWLVKLQSIGILGDFIPIGTSVDCGCDVNVIKYRKNCGDSSMLEFSVSLESEYLVTTFPKSFKYKNVLVSISTQYDVEAGDVGEIICNEDDFIDNIKIIMSGAR